MTLSVDYSTGKRKLWDCIAGFVSAVVINAVILISSLFLQKNSHLAAYIDLLPWIVNGLFLLVFMIILPQFALGYLIAVSVFIAAPLFVIQTVTSGYYFIKSVFALANMLLARPHELLAGIRMILRILAIATVIAAIASIWATAIYYSEKQQNK